MLLANNNSFKSKWWDHSASWKIPSSFSLLYFAGKRHEWWASIIFSALYHTVCQRKPIYYLISGLNIPFSFFSGIAYLKEKTRTNQGVPINLVKIYFYFDLSPWLFKGYCRTYRFCFLFVSRKQGHFMKAIIILCRYRIHWSEEWRTFDIYWHNGFHFGNSSVFLLNSCRWAKELHWHMTLSVP